MASDKPPRRRAGEVLRDLEAAESRATPEGAQAAIASGSLGYGAGGPVFLDQFRSRRAPAPTELAEQYKAVAYACIQLNGWGVAPVPLRLYCRTGPRDRAPRRDVVPVPRDRMAYLLRHRAVHRSLLGAKEVHEVADHPWLEALDAPNPHFDGSAFIFYLSACLDVFGRFYFYPERIDRTWAGSTWWPLQPQYVLPTKGDARDILRGYTYFGQDFAPDELETGRFTSLRDPYLSGYAPLHACYEQLGLTNIYTATMEDLLGAGARPSGLVGPKDAAKAPWTEAQRKRIEADVNGKYSRGGQGRVWVVDGSYDFTPTTFPPIDLGGEEISKSARLTAANCFSVPISLLQTEDSNRAVAEAGNYQHQRNAIRPRCTAIAAGLTKMAKAVDPRYFFCFDNPVERDEVTTAKVFDLKVRNCTLKINEARAEDGLEPVEWGEQSFLELQAKFKPALPAPGDAGGEGGKKPKGDDAGGGKKREDQADDGEDAEAAEAERALLAESNELMGRMLERLHAIDDAKSPEARRRGRRSRRGGPGVDRVEGGAARDRGAEG